MTDATPPAPADVQVRFTAYETKTLIRRCEREIKLIHVEAMRKGGKLQKEDKDNIRRLNRIIEKLEAAKAAK